MRSLAACSISKMATVQFTPMWRIYFNSGIFYKRLGDCVDPVVFGLATDVPREARKDILVFGFPARITLEFFQQEGDE